MNLMEKLEKLGLDEVKQRCAGVSPMALLVALENLCYSNDEDLLDSLDSSSSSQPYSRAVARAGGVAARAVVGAHRCGASCFGVRFRLRRYTSPHRAARQSGVLTASLRG